jgi:hypothetical protein
MQLMSHCTWDKKKFAKGLSKILMSIETPYISFKWDPLRTPDANVACSTFVHAMQQICFNIPFKTRKSKVLSTNMSQKSFQQICLDKSSFNKFVSIKVLSTNMSQQSFQITPFVFSSWYALAECTNKLDNLRSTVAFKTNTCNKRVDAGALLDTQATQSSLELKNDKTFSKERRQMPGAFRLATSDKEECACKQFLRKRHYTSRHARQGTVRRRGTTRTLEKRERKLGTYHHLINRVDDVAHLISRDVPGKVELTYIR